MEQGIFFMEQGAFGREQGLWRVFFVRRPFLAHLFLRLPDAICSHRLFLQVRRNQMPD
jgi:hypothetical protein